jgi:uncharacterized protein (DUF1330 family)
MEPKMVTVLAFVTVAEDAPDALAAYFRVTDPLLKKAGAKIVKRFSIHDVIVGKKPAQTVVMVEYPSREAVDMVFGSAEYAAVIEYRDRAFLDYAITIIDDPMEPAIQQPATP